MATHEMKVTFGEGLEVNAEYKGYVIKTDQPVHQGGGGTAPAPFDLFLASLATCAGFYAMIFCKERKIPIEGLGVSMAMERGQVSKMIDKIAITVDLPAGFPEKYKFAIVKAVDRCTVKLHIMRAPEFSIVTRDHGQS